MNKKFSIMYWEDRDGSIDDVSMDLEEFMRIVQAGVSGDRELFKELRTEIIDIVKEYQRTIAEQS